MPRGSLYTQRQWERARSLYVCSGQTFPDVSAIMGISENALRVQAEKTGWEDAKQRYMAQGSSLPERMQAFAGMLEEIALHDYSEAEKTGTYRKAQESLRSVVYSQVSADHSFRHHFRLIESDPGLQTILIMKRFTDRAKAMLPEPILKRLGPVVQAFLMEEKQHLQLLESRETSE